MRMLLIGLNKYFYKTNYVDQAKPGDLLTFESDNIWIKLRHDKLFAHGCACLDAVSGCYRAGL